MSYGSSLYLRGNKKTLRLAFVPRNASSYAGYKSKLFYPRLPHIALSSMRSSPDILVAPQKVAKFYLV